MYTCMSEKRFTKNRKKPDWSPRGPYIGYAEVTLENSEDLVYIPWNGIHPLGHIKGEENTE